MFGLFKKKTPDTLVEVLAPCPGKLLPLNEVPDPTFAQGLLGEGFAVEPAQEVAEINVCAPVSGQIKKIFRTGHAFSLISTEGLEILVHIGLETVELKGQGFTALVDDGQIVEVGTPIIRVAAKEIRAAGYPLVTPVVFTKKAQIAALELLSVGEVLESSSDDGSKNRISVVAQVKLANSK